MGLSLAQNGKYFGKFHHIYVHLLFFILYYTPYNSNGFVEYIVLIQMQTFCGLLYARK